MTETRKNDITYRLDALVIPPEEVGSSSCQKGPTSTDQEIKMVVKKQTPTKTVEPEAHVGLMAYEIFHSRFMHPNSADMPLALATSNSMVLNKKNRNCGIC
eukprot:Ihof_evm3s453 gene=Ihof_evmTU3s453